MNAPYCHQIKQIKCASELLRVISRSDFIIIGSYLTTKVAQTILPFQNIMGTKRNIKFKSNPSMVHCQKSTNFFKFIQEEPTVPSRKARNNELSWTRRTAK